MFFRTALLLLVLASTVFAASNNALLLFQGQVTGGAVNISSGPVITDIPGTFPEVQQLTISAEIPMLLEPSKPGAPANCPFEATDGVMFAEVSMGTETEVIPIPLPLIPNFHTGVYFDGSTSYPPYGAFQCPVLSPVPDTCAFCLLFEQRALRYDNNFCFSTAHVSDYGMLFGVTALPFPEAEVDGLPLGLGVNFRNNGGPPGADVTMELVLDVFFSCPYLFVNTVDGMIVQADVNGAGTLASSDTPKAYPNDYFVLTSTPKVTDGHIHVSLVEEREETSYTDTAKLYTVDLPAGRQLIYQLRQVNDFPNAINFHTISATNVPAAKSCTIIESGSDCTELVRAKDNKWLELGTDKNQVDAAHGLPATLELDLGDVDTNADIKLVFFYATLYPNKPGVVGSPAVNVQVPASAGGWVTTTSRVSTSSDFPRQKAIFVPKSVWQTTARKVRLTFVWMTLIDSIGVDATPDDVVTFTPLALDAAVLRHHGLDLQLPYLSPKLTTYYYVPNDGEALMLGNYTKYGNVLPLLTAKDDQNVVYGGGDELIMAFKAPDAPPAPATPNRHFVFFSSTFYKGGQKTGDVNVGPLPFNAMPSYPYTASLYPSSLDAYNAEWNTRVSSTLAKRQSSAFINIVITGNITQLAGPLPTE